MIRAIVFFVLGFASGIFVMFAWLGRYFIELDELMQEAEEIISQSR